MKTCWKYDSEKRPAFSSLVQRINIAQKPETKGGKKQGAATYENVTR